MEIKDGDLTYLIIGSAMRVHTALGPGLREKPYENALAIELKDLGIEFLQQPTYSILYKEQHVGFCQPDLVVEDEVVVDCKSIHSIGEEEVGQILNYLRITKKRVGLILNFRGTKLEQRRVQL